MWLYTEEKTHITTPLNAAHWTFNLTLLFMKDEPVFPKGKGRLFL